MVQKLIPVLLIGGFCFVGFASAQEWTVLNGKEECARTPRTEPMESICSAMATTETGIGLGLDESSLDTVRNHAMTMMDACRADNRTNAEGAQKADRDCASGFGYGVKDSTIASLKGNSKPKSGSNCAENAECATMEVFFTNYGMSRSASTAAILYGLGKIDSPEARAAQERFLNQNSSLKRQISCAAEQAEFFEGQCARMVSANDIRGEPYKSDASKFFSQEFFGLGETDENGLSKPGSGLHVADLAQGILAGFNECAKQGSSASECRLNPDIFKQKNLTDDKGFLKSGVDGSIYLPSDSFLNSVGEISKKHKLDDEKGREEFAKKLNQEFAGAIIPKLIEESKLATLHKQVKDEDSRRKYCADAGKIGVKPPSTSQACQDAYYDAYMASPDKDSQIDTSDREAFFTEVNKGLGRTLTGEDVGIPELAEAHGAFAAIRELSLIEARNNPDIFRQANLYAGGTPIKATNLAREAASTGTPNPKVQNYAQASSGDSGISPMGGMGRMIDGDADADGDSGASGVEPRVSGAVLPPAQGSDVRPEGEGSMDAVARAKHMLEERPTGSFPPSNIHDYNEDYMDCSTQCRNGMADGPGNFMDQLIVYRNSSGSITRDVFRISENPDR